MTLPREDRRDLEVSDVAKCGKTRMKGPKSTERAENTTTTKTGVLLAGEGEVDDLSASEECAEFCCEPM